MTVDWMRESKLRQMRTTPNEEIRIATCKRPFLGEIDGMFGSGLDRIFRVETVIVVLGPLE
jgi:hypothetical protein